MIFWRKRPERKDEVHEFPVWNVHEARGRSTAVGRNAPSRTQTIILQVIYCTEFSIVRTKNGGPDWKPIQIQSFRFSIVRDIQ